MAANVENAVGAVAVEFTSLMKAAEYCVLPRLHRVCTVCSLRSVCILLCVPFFPFFPESKCQVFNV